MLKRQKTLLALLECLERPVGFTTVVKLAFLLREETDIAENHAFYDFVPYRYGPFSFALYRELRMLERDGYLDLTTRSVTLRDVTRHLAHEKVSELPIATRDAIKAVAGRYGVVAHDRLLRDVYLRYPWYASRTEMENYLSVPRLSAEPGPIAIYTIGYEGKSVDGLFNLILQQGIRTLIDIRSNPVSRSYGFSHTKLAKICAALDVDYRQMPELGITSLKRKALANGVTRRALLDEYEETRLPQSREHVLSVTAIIKNRPSVLLCLESNPDECHRSRLANTIAEATGLAIVNL